MKILSWMQVVSVADTRLSALRARLASPALGSIGSVGAIGAVGAIGLAPEAGPVFERELEPLLRALQEDPLTAPLSRARLFALVAEAAAGAFEGSKF